jgi:hypothetical protein
MFPKHLRKPVGSTVTSYKVPAIPHPIFPLYSTFPLKMPQFLGLTGEMSTEPNPVEIYNEHSLESE